MDRRTIFFVILVSVALFGVNIFFQWRHDQEVRDYKVQMQAWEKAERERLRGEIATRSLPLEQIPVADIFTSEDATQASAMAVQLGEHYLTLAQGEEPPQEVWVKKGDKQTPVFLQGAAWEMGFPLLYGPKDASPLNVEDVSHFGTVDVQLINFGSDHLILQSTLGVAADGSFSPLLDGPARNSLAFVRMGKQFIPVGLYNSETKSLVGPDSLPQLGTVSMPEKPVEVQGGSRAPSYYVLSTPVQQLVFSDQGGALVEINLAFESDEVPQSIVKEIEYDRDMQENHPYNDYYPQNGYYLPAEGNSGSFKKVEKGQLGGYYPLLRRNLVEISPRPTVVVPPAYHAFNLVSEYPEQAEMFYEVKKFTDKEIVFEARNRYRRITKTYRLPEDPTEAPYVFDLTVDIEGSTRGLWLTSGIPDVEMISGNPSPELKQRINRQGSSAVEQISLPKGLETLADSTSDWFSNGNGFFGILIDPQSELGKGFTAMRVEGDLVPSRLVEIDQEYDLYPASSMPGYMMQFPLRASAGETHFRIFAGPYAEPLLKQLDATFMDPKTGQTPGYSEAQSFHGWFAFISAPFSKFLFILMRFFHDITSSWGFSIILLTVVLRIMLYPLNAWSMKSMRRMQEISPLVQEIQKKHKKDPKKAQMEVMRLYRETGANPFTGCLPLFIQMPFLIGMFDLLKSAFELRGAPFIPGWIDNLTAPDVLFSWHYPIFFFGTEFHLLPILLGVVMWLTQRMSSKLPKDPSLWTEQQRQQRTMGNMMTLMFAVMFYHFPSGLNIYWLSSMILGMGQQWLTNRQVQKESLLKKSGIKPVA